MSIHRSLVTKSTLRRHRSVLTRAERVKELADQDKLAEEDSVFGLPKVRVRRVKAAKHKKVAKAAEGEEAAEAAEATAEGEQPQEEASS